MFGISGEHLLILAIVLIIFGPRRLPELGNTLGKAIRNFKDSISGIEEAAYRKIDDSDAKRSEPESAQEQKDSFSTQLASKSPSQGQREPGSTPVQDSQSYSPGLQQAQTTKPFNSQILSEKEGTSSS